MDHANLFKPKDNKEKYNPKVMSPELNTKIDNKILYGTGEPPATLDAGVVYFQIEE